VRSKVVSTFLQLFDDPSDVQWNLNENQYLASFKNKDHLYKALFSVGGDWLYSIQYGTQEDLPRDVYRMVKATYIDHNISVVIEVKALQAQTWIVNLENKDNLVLVKIVDGQLEELQRYKTLY
jgi:hypothetical protein